MSKRHENPIKKDKKKIKRRVKAPVKIDDFVVNTLIDLKNYDVRMNAIKENIYKLERYGWQISHNIEEILKILKENNIYTSVMKKERI